MRGTLLILLIVLTILGWCLYGDLNLEVAAYFTEHRADDLAKAGQWGDTFGAFTALFSALGTIGVIWTLALQQRSIREQAKDLHRQRFDATFFQMLELLKQTKAEVRFNHSPGYVSARYPTMSAAGRASMTKDSFGLGALIKARTEIGWWVQQAGPIGTLSASQLGSLYQRRAFDRFPGRLGAYYRLLYSILQRIDRDNVLSVDEKADYSRLLRAQLTSDEILLLALNGLTSMSGDLARLIVTYRMLKYIKTRKYRAILQDYYPDVAYEPRD